MKKRLPEILFIAVLTLFAAMYCLPPESRPTSKLLEAFGANPHLEPLTRAEERTVIDSLYGFFSETVHLGLDLVGGAELRYRIDPDDIPGEGGGDNTRSRRMNDIMEDVKNVIERRIATSGIVQEPLIRREGKFDLVVQLPGLTEQETEEVKKLITALASLKFRLVAEDSVMQAELQKKNQGGDKYQLSPELAEKYKWYRTKNGQDILLEEIKHPDYTIDGKGGSNHDFNGSKIEAIGKTYDDRGQVVPNFTLYQKYRKKFGDFTQKHINRYMAIVHNNIVASYPEIQSRIEGNGIITGMDYEEVEELVALMKSGSLEFTPSKVSENKVGPSLGEDAIAQAYKVGIMGAGVTFLFMVGFYQGCGLISFVSVIINILLIFAWLSISGATLTLPGIGGLLLTLGMAVDGSIIIFERIREERAKNKSLRQATESGFENANSTIVDSNITTLITAWILYYFGSGPVQGFATTLAAGVIFNLFTTLFVIRSLMFVFLENNAFKEMRMANLIKETKIDFMGTKSIAFAFSVIAIFAGLTLFASRGHRNFGIDFNGGVLVQMRFKDDQAKSHKEVAERVSTYVAENSVDGKPKYPDAEVQSIISEESTSPAGTFNEFLVRTKNLNQDELVKVRLDIRQKEKELDQERKGENRRDVEETIQERLAELQKQRTDLENMDYLKTDLQKIFKQELIPDAFSFEQRSGEGESSKVMLHVNLLHPITKDEAIRLLEKEAEFTEPEVILLPKPSDGGELEKSHTFQMVVQSSSLENVKKDIRATFARTENYKLSSPFTRSEQISGVIAQKQKQDAVFAVFWALLAIIAYITIRFEFKFGLAAVICLFHDVLFTLGTVSFVKYMGWVNVEIDLSTIAAFLTIIGYSLNDTIVVFDRIRENLVKPKGTFKEVVNLSINQTLARTLLTSSTTILITLLLFIVNQGHSGMLEGFSFTMLVGIVIGTYSSIYIASALLVTWSDDSPEEMAKLAKKSEEKPKKVEPQPQHQEEEEDEEEEEPSEESESSASEEDEDEDEEEEKKETAKPVDNSSTSKKPAEAKKENSSSSNSNKKKRKKKKKK